MNPCVAVHIHNEGVVRVGHIHLHLTEGNVNGDTDIYIGELWLGSKENRAALGQVANGGIVEAVGLGCGVKAALGVHVELTVALAPIHRCAIEGVFALGTLLPVAVFAVTLRAAQTGGGLCVVLAGATCAIMFITRVCMAITLTLLTLPLQQKVATEAALTLVPHTVVLAIHTHSILFCWTLRHPVLNAVGVQRVEPWVFKGLLMFIPGQTHSTVSPAKLSTWTTSAAALGRANEQWLTLLTVLTHGVIVALETNVWFVNTSTVAVFVAAALRGTVVPHEAKMTPANSWGHTCPVHTAL